jgi:amidase
MVPIALAADGGGSIRMPASNCGLVGLKPGHGVVPFPQTGVSTWARMSEFGPLATTVADLALALDVLAGGDRFRAVAPPERPLRVGVSAKPGAVGVKVDPRVRAVMTPPPTPWPAPATGSSASTRPGATATPPRSCSGCSTAAPRTPTA